MSDAVALRPFANARDLRLALCWVVGLAGLALIYIALRWILGSWADAPEPYRPLAVAAGSRPSIAGPAIAAPPAPEPMELIEITPASARAINAKIPFASGPNPAARPFHFPGAAADRERAETCLASAVWYEAGNDVVGQQAVAQVVLNRLRHPAFPKTVCGVVFQGMERSTGCQFTFTCDGALARIPPANQWKAARDVARKALSGFVYSKVGLATHYHTDWVVPYWSASLDKIAEVHTHLFFRWKGWWGTPPAFRRGYLGDEKLPRRIAEMFGGAAASEDLADAMLEGDAGTRPAMRFEAVPASGLGGNVVRLVGETGTEYIVQLDPDASASSYFTLALRLCKGKPVCTVSGWLDPKRLPSALPVSIPNLRTTSFLYFRNSELKREQVLWNCSERPRLKRSECLPGTESAAANDEAVPNAGRPQPVDRSS